MFHNSRFCSGLLFCLESLTEWAETIMAGLLLGAHQTHSHTLRIGI